MSSKSALILMCDFCTRTATIDKSVVDNPQYYKDDNPDLQELKRWSTVEWDTRHPNSRSGSKDICFSCLASLLTDRLVGGKAPTLESAERLRRPHRD